MVKLSSGRPIGVGIRFGDHRIIEVEINGRIVFNDRSRR